MEPTPPLNRAGLELTQEEIAAVAVRVAEMIGGHRATLAQRPVGRTATVDELQQRLGPIGEVGTDPAVVLEELADVVLPNVVQQDHPRYFASIPSPGNGISAFAEALAAGFNVFGGNWAEGSGGSAIELACIEWLCDLCQLPAGAGGLFTSGGTAATLTALVAARQWAGIAKTDRAVLYTSVEGHLSIERAAKVMGLQPAHIRKLEVDDRLRLEPAALRAAITRDRATGAEPFAVVATAGSTSTALIDPLPDLARICRQEGLWLHVDAAYGGPALLTEKGRVRLDGLKDADSITIDPHKWLFQPFGLGSLLVREPRVLRDTFRLVPAYLEELSSVENVDFYDYGIEVSRPFRALRLWLSLRVFGVAAFREAVERGFELAEAVEESVREDPRLEVVSPAALGIVCFSYNDPNLTESACGEVCDRATKEVSADGWAVVGCTNVAGRRVMRMCTMNPRTTLDDVRATVRLLADAASNAAMSMEA